MWDMERGESKICSISLLRFQGEYAMMDANTRSGIWTDGRGVVGKQGKCGLHGEKECHDAEDANRKRTSSFRKIKDFVRCGKI